MQAKKLQTSFLFIVCALISSSTMAQNSDYLWTWIGGTTQPFNNGNRGPLGVPGSDFFPDTRQNSAYTTDNDGNMWLYGGNYEADLWKFDGINWTWVNGPITSRPAAIFGDKGVAHPDNNPGQRHTSKMVADSQGNLWLFGGYASWANSYMNDLWKFDGTNWTWVAGDSIASNQNGDYSDPMDINPDPRIDHVMLIDSQDRIYVYAGFGYTEVGSSGLTNYLGTLNDLLMFENGTWKLLSGDQINRANNWTTYGQQGVTVSTNNAGARAGAYGWVDVNDHIFIFGGDGVYHLNDTFKWDGTNWTWIHGPAQSGNSAVSSVGVFGVKGVADPANYPPVRANSSFMQASNGDVFIFGGYYLSNRTSPSVGNLNDLWKWDGSAWTSYSDGFVLDEASTGNLNEEDSNNRPGGRYSNMGWVDNNSNVFIFGGRSTTNPYSNNELWKFSESIPSISISQIFPEAATEGDQVYIYGANFSSTPGDNMVLIGGVTATVTNATTNRLTVEVPTLSRGLPTVIVTKDGESDELINAFQFLVPSAPNFESEVLLFSLNDIININAGDFNNNGDIDLVANSGAQNEINIYYNNQNFQFTSVTNIHSAFENHDVQPVDIDNDGDLDVIASLITQNTPSNTADDRLSLFTNNGPPSNPTYTESTISANINGARDVYPADLDGDGDNDVIAVSFVSGSLTWFRNDNGFFNSSFNITSSAPNVGGVHAADLNNDGLMDVLSAGEFVVSWYPNEGNGVFTQKIDLISDEAPVGEVKAADLNGDGFLDVVTNAADSTIVWFQNDGSGNFTRKNVATDLFDPVDFLPADLDGDGDMDIIASSNDNGEIVWYQNFGDGRFSTKNVISETLDRAFGLDAADYDNDGDIDIIAAQRFAGDAPGAYLFENTSVVDDPFAFFPFNGDNLDAGSSAFAVNTIGNPILASDPGGAIDSAYFFDGTDDYVQTQENNPFEFQSFTFSMWLNTYSLPEPDKASVFLAKQPGNVQTGYTLSVYPDGGIFTTIYDSGGGNTRRTGYTVNIGEWTHFAVTYDGSVLQTYVNGVPEAAQQFDAEIVYDSTPLTIGGYNHPTNSFNGKLDEVRIYDVALSSSELASIYQSEKPDVFDNTSQWTSVISTAINGKQSSAEFGTQPASTDGFDQGFDIPLPPAPTGDYIQLFFAHPEFGGSLGDNYRSDFKAYSDYSSSNTNWELSLFSTISGSESLTISRPAGFEAPIKVIDESGNEFISLTGNLEVPYSISANQTLLFDIVVGDITPPELNLNANMDGPQIWDVEFSRTLNWTATDPSGIVNNTLDVSYDGGTNWNTIYTGTANSFVFMPEQFIIFNEETFFRVTSTDRASANFANSVTKESVHAISIMSSSQNLSFNQGWQMVGAPFEQGIENGSVLSSAIRYIWNNPTSEYLLTETYPAKEGIWLGGYSNGSDQLEGTVRESDATITAKAGWNLVTSTLLRNVKTDSILVDNDGTVSSFSDAVNTSTVTQPYAYDGSGYINPTSFDISGGYWLGVTVDSVELTLPIHQFDPPLKRMVKASPESYVTLTIVDGDTRQDLSVVLGEGASQPAPPPAPNTYSLGLVGESTVLGSLYLKQYVSEAEVESLEIPLSVAGPERMITLKWEVQGFEGIPYALMVEDKLEQGSSGELELSIEAINNTKLAFGGMVVSNEDLSEIPTELRLDQNYPNPFNPSTNITFGLPSDSRVTLSVYNMLGQQVAQILDNKSLKAGTHKISFDASSLSSGTYLYRIETGELTITKKMMLIK